MAATCTMLQPIEHMIDKSLSHLSFASPPFDGFAKYLLSFRYTHAYSAYIFEKKYNIIYLMLSIRFCKSFSVLSAKKRILGKEGNWSPSYSKMLTGCFMIPKNEAASLLPQRPRKPAGFGKGIPRRRSNPGKRRSPEVPHEPGEKVLFCPACLRTVVPKGWMASACTFCRNFSVTSSGM